MTDNYSKFNGLLFKSLLYIFPLKTSYLNILNYKIIIRDSKLTLNCPILIINNSYVKWNLYLKLLDIHRVIMEFHGVKLNNLQIHLL